jgi:uridine phosphorylase
MERDDAPILEFDPSPTAVIEPTEHIDPTDIPDRAVLCFFQDVIAKAVDEFDGREIDEVRSEIGLVPVYELSFEGTRLALPGSLRS